MDEGMKIIFYCQYVFGMGHLFRTIELARALSNDDVTLVVGGKEIHVDLPGHVSLVQLPALYMDEKFTRLIPADPDASVAEIKQRRKEILFSLFREKQPQIFMVELYPFGRTIFGFELIPLLKEIRSNTFGSVKTVCSLRDVLVEKRDPVEYEQRVIDNLNQYFDLLLIHSDAEYISLEKTFSRAEQINIPVQYTGFVAQKVEGTGRKSFRTALGLDPDEKLIVASAGGGRSGYRLLSGVADACRLLTSSHRVRLQMFTGPFLNDAAYQKLAAKAGPNIQIHRFTKDFLSYLLAADLSLSMAGYNTCMNILVTRVPALVWPYPKDREQGLRAERLAAAGNLKVLSEKDIDPDRLAGIVEKNLLQPARPKNAIDLNGAAKTAELIANWMKTDQGSGVGGQGQEIMLKAENSCRESGLRGQGLE